MRSFRRFAVFVVALAAFGLAVALTPATPAHAQEELIGCGADSGFNHPAYDNAYIQTSDLRPHTFKKGDTVTVKASPSLRGFPLEGTIFIGTGRGNPFLAQAPAQGTLVTLTYTFPADTVSPVGVGIDRNPSTEAVFEVSCVNIPPVQYTATATGRFGHGDEISVTRFERPNVVFQFGNPGGEPLQNVVLTCTIPEGEQATFTNQVYTHGAFSSVQRTEKTLVFSGRASVPRGQNFNVQFAVNPGMTLGGTSTITCVLSGSNFAPVTDTLVVRVR
jgi:hypothetical protein